MSVYYMNEAAFEIPDELGLEDRTTTTLEATSRDGFSHLFRVYRQPAPEGKSLPEIVAGNIREANIRLRAHRVLHRRDIEIAGLPAIELGTSWHGRRGLVYTRQAHVLLPGAWMVFAGNVDMPDREACDAWFDHVISTFRLRSA